MRLRREEVYHLIAVVKGDVAATLAQRRKARVEYRALLDCLTREIQEQAPGDLSVTHESIEVTLEQAYRHYRQRIARTPTP